MTNALTMIQKKFADLYLQGMTAADAARNCGLKCAKANMAIRGYQILNDPKVAAYIKERAKEIEDARIADIQEIQILWTRVLRGEIKDITVGRCGPDGELGEIEVSPSIKERLRASELLGKAKGIFMGSSTTDLKTDLITLIKEMPEDEFRRQVEILAALAQGINQSSPSPGPAVS